MAYVDLNPNRNKIASTPETSEFNSVKKHIEVAKSGQLSKTLLRFAGRPKQHMPKGLPFELKSYLGLVELTGRYMREDKRGYIDKSQPELLTRLNISHENWLKVTSSFTCVFHGAVGNKQAFSEYCVHLHIKRRTNCRICEKLLTRAFIIDIPVFQC